MPPPPSTPDPGDDDRFAPGMDEGTDGAYDDTYDPVFDALADSGDVDEAGATAGADAIAGIFLAADTLQHRPDDENAALAMLDAIDKADGRTPFGMAPEWWSGVVRDARSLAASVPVADAGSVMSAAHDLWARLRDYV